MSRLMPDVDENLARHPSARHKELVLSLIINFSYKETTTRSSSRSGEYTLPPT